MNQENNTLNPMATSDLMHTSEPTGSSHPMGNCTKGSPVVWKGLGMCLENGLQYVAFLCAIASLCLFLMSHIFLLRARHFEGNASRRQFLTLIHICSANVCNLVGAILSHQLGTQVLIAGYFLGSDVIFFIHFLYVWCSFTPRQTDGIPYSEWRSPDRARGKQNGSRTRVMCFLLTWLPAMIYLPLKSSPWQQDQMQKFGPGRKLLSVGQSSVDNFGFTLGVIAMLAYALAKVPLVKDGLRQNENLLRHFKVINFAVMAHIGYVLSIILYSQELIFLLNALPWLIMSGVCTFFDVILVYLIARQHRQIAREKAATRWEDNRNPRVREYEDGREDGRGLEDEDETWTPGVEPRLAAIHEDEEDEDSDEPRHTSANVDEEVGDRKSPIQAIPPPPQHPRGGRRQKTPTKARADSFGDDLEWDLSDMSKTYKEDDEEGEEDEDDEEIVWDEELIQKEVAAELRRRELEGEGVHPHDDHSDVSVESLEFEEIPVDENMADGMQNEWYEG